jgi:type I restriction enzyme S subunit
MRETLVKTEEFKDSPLGKIPADWEVLTFEDVSTVRQGLQIAISRRFKDYKPGRYIYITVEYLNNIANSHLLEFIESPGNRVICHQDDVLVTRTGATGKIITDVEGVFHNNFFLVDYDRSKVNRDYLVCYLNLEQIQKEIKLRAGTTTIPDLKHRDFYSLTFLRPPLAEQEKIAVILKSCDETIARTSSLIAKLKLMKAGLLHDLLTRGLDENGKLRDAIGHPEQFKDSPLGRIPKDWEAEPFGGHIAQLDSGWSPVCDSEPAANGEWGILKTTAVVWSGYNPLENKKLPSNLQPRYQAVVEADDILITRKGPRERVGVVVHIPLTPPQLMMPDTVFRVRLKESSTLLPAFVPLTLGSIVVQRDWNRKKIGLAEAQVDINYGIVRETLIYIPPKPEQERIVGIINNYNTRIRTEEAYRDKLKLQKQGLMHDLLTGKVRVKDADKFTPASDKI